MRRRTVVWLLALCACENRYGSYFKIDGEGNEIRFDKVHLYWGNDPHQMPLGTPDGAMRGTVYTREYDAASDEYPVPHNGDGSLAMESTYWLPVTEDNRQLGYVAAVVYDSSMPDKPVGVGEWQDFSLEDNLVAKFDIELQKPPLNVIDKLELWGNAPGCFAWQHQRETGFSTIAVLSATADADCDGLVADADCNDACPTGATGCDPEATLCGSTTTCGIGCAHQGFCAIQVCAPTAACGPCLAKPTFDEQMKCASDTTADHIQIDVDMMNGTPCARSFTIFPYQKQCLNPKPVWFENLNDNWTMSAQPGASGGSVTILIDSPSATQSFSDDHHILVSCDPLSGTMSRWTFMVGVQPGASGCNIDPGGFKVRDPQLGMPYFCP